ncbi:MAG: DUF1501 domain-containing protein [Thermoguttaceae bacterium]|nr:DUF1501 domain-containing protein [Thermoguttaceae bacterium]
MRDDACFRLYLSRRKFIRMSVAGTTLGLLPGACLFPLTQPAGKQPVEGAKGRSVIVIQLTGGNDILNTVIPYQDPAYFRARPTLNSVAKKARPISDNLAFHPALDPLRELFQDGQLAILQGVGYPQSSRDHQQAIRDWYTALPGDTVERTGWIGRACDILNQALPSEVHALFVGTIPLPQALVGRSAVVPRIRDANNVNWEPLPAGDWEISSGEPPDEGTAPLTAEAQDLLRHLRQTATQAQRVAKRVQAAVEKVAPQLDAARFELERRLQLIASLIDAEVGVRFFFTDFGGPEPGGFDTHANQLDNHHALLTELAQGIASFAHHTEKLGIADRVLLMTFSEFGRTLAENGRHGTDHGAATSLFVFGKAVQGGLVGKHPSLYQLDQGGLIHHTDFRAVYKSLLEDWLGVPAEPVLGPVPGPVPLFVKEEYRAGRAS